MDPDIEAVIQMVPLMFLFFICRAAAWTERKVPSRQHPSPNRQSRALTSDVDLHDPPKVLCGIVQSRYLLLNPSCSKESSNWGLAIVVHALESLVHCLLIRNVQLSIFHLGAVFLRSLLSDLPFGLGRTREDIGTINVGGVGFEQSDSGS